MGAREGPQSVQNCQKRPFWAISGSGGSNWWNKVEQGWNKSGHIPGDALEQFWGSGRAIWVCQRAPKRIQNGQKQPFWAISRSGGSKLAEQCGVKVEQVRAHPQ